MIKEIVCSVESAYADNEYKGIYLGLITEENKKITTFVPTEMWGRIPEGNDVKKELDIIIDLFNGYRILPDGKRELIENFQYKKIKIIQE